MAVLSFSRQISNHNPQEGETIAAAKAASRANQYSRLFFIGLAAKAETGQKSEFGQNNAHCAASQRDLPMPSAIWLQCNITLIEAAR